MESTQTTPVQASKKGKAGLIITILIILIIAAAAIILSQKPGSNVPHVDAAALTAAPFTNASSSFSIQFPEGWKTDESGQFGALVFALNPVVDKDGDSSFSTNMNVTSEAVQNATLDEYIKATLDALPKFLSEYKTTENKEVTVNGLPGRLIGGTFTQGKLKLRNTQLLVIDKGTAYVVTGTALQSNWKSYADVIAASSMTFKLTK